MELLAPPAHRSIKSQIVNVILRQSLSNQVGKMLVFAVRQRSAGYPANALGKTGGHGGSSRRSILRRGLLSFGLSLKRPFETAREFEASPDWGSTCLVCASFARSNLENADSARRCRFRNSQQKRASDLDPTYVWIPKLDVTGSNPVSRSIFSITYKELKYPPYPPLRSNHHAFNSLHAIF